MKTVLLKSIRTNIITTRVLLTTTILLSVVCVSLIIAFVYQTNHYHELLTKQTETFQETLDEQTDKYLDLVKAEEPMKTNYPKKNIGKFQLSFYTPTELGKPLEALHTATNTRPKEGRTIAVDPKVIPYGSTVYIEGFGYYIAEDTGGAIKGNRIDIFMLDYNKAIKLGKPYANVHILGKK